MGDPERDVKQRILDAAIELIRNEQAVEKVSLRKVAKMAGVSVSMVNYHYQTKSNLMNQAVQRFVGTVIEEAADDGERGDADPLIRMRANLQNAARFVAENPGVSRVSILSDMKDGTTLDNSSQVAQGVYEELSAVMGESGDHLRLKVLAEIQVAAVQHFFLRAAAIRERTGLNFFDEEERKVLLDIIIETVTGRKVK